MINFNQPTASGNIVPFGKYRGQPAELMLADQDYLRWIKAQPGLMQMLHDKHVVIFNLITVGAAKTDDTPEHNRLQARFVDRAFQLAFYRAVTGNDGGETWVSFEHGFDVLVKVGNYWNCRIEIKPDLGDDCMDVLRQMRRNQPHQRDYEFPYYDRRLDMYINCDALLIERYNGQGATLEQVKAMFGEYKIVLLSEVERCLTS